MLYTFALQNIRDRFGYILVLAGNQAGGHFDDRDLAAEPAIDLCEFEPNIAAADHDQVPRQDIELENRAIGEIVDLVEPRHVRNESASADIDEYLLRLQCLITNRNLACGDKSGVILINRAPFGIAK